MISWWWLVVEFIACILGIGATLLIFGRNMEHKLRTAYLAGIKYASVHLRINKDWRYKDESEY